MDLVKAWEIGLLDFEMLQNYTFGIVSISGATKTATKHLRSVNRGGTLYSSRSPDSSLINMVTS